MLRCPVGKLILLLLLVGFRGSAGPLPAPGFLQSVDFYRSEPKFGGFSALHLTPDGLSFVALSDDGIFVTGSFTRDTTGRITAFTTSPVKQLLRADGKLLPHDQSDSEGLAIAGDGTIYISFESPARVWRYPKLGGVPVRLPDHPDFAEMQSNRELEALAVAKDGTIFTIPEISPAPDAAFPVYRFRNGIWDTPYTFSRDGGFMVSDATIGPDGRFYVLEREFLGAAGFATRLRRFDLTDRGLSAETVVLQTEPGAHDNLEGLAIWRDAKGLRATMVSDDNFIAMLRSEFVEYRLPD